MSNSDKIGLKILRVDLGNFSGSGYLESSSLKKTELSNDGVLYFSGGNSRDG